MKFMLFPVSFLLLTITVAAKDEKCPELYKRFSSHHTFCLPPNGECSITKRGVNDKDKELILKLHNDYRSKIATGQETNAGGMPSAANMLEMVWDDELARVAQKLVETCKYGHDCNQCRMVHAFPVGQNIGRVSNLSKQPETADWTSFIKNLYDEVSRFNKIHITPYVPGPHTEKDQYGHFTQMVWASSWKMGCGWALFKKGNTFTSYTVCNYGPSGNVEDGEMYQTGKPCSACPKNSCCGDSCKGHQVTSKYPGLCKVIIPSMSPDGPGLHESNFLFYCDFNNQSDCSVTFEGKPWTIVRTAGGNWMSIILKGGEKTKLVFQKKFATSSEFCIQISVRSGPNVDGQAESGEGISLLTIGKSEEEFDLDYEGVPKELRQDFMSMFYEMGVLQKSDVQYSFSYTVPSGAPAQFVELREVSAKSGPCPE